jgi:hypothetical protein
MNFENKPDFDIPKQSAMGRAKRMPGNRVFIHSVIHKRPRKSNLSFWRNGNRRIFKIDVQLLEIRICRRNGKNAG